MATPTKGGERVSEDGGLNGTPSLTPNVGETRLRTEIAYVCAQCEHAWTSHAHRGRRGGTPNVSMWCTRRACPCEIRLPTVKHAWTVEERYEIWDGTTGRGQWVRVRMVVP